MFLKRFWPYGHTVIISRMFVNLHTVRFCLSSSHSRGEWCCCNKTMDLFIQSRFFTGDWKYIIFKVLKEKVRQKFNNCLSFEKWEPPSFGSLSSFSGSVSHPGAVKHSHSETRHWMSYFVFGDPMQVQKPTMLCKYVAVRFASYQVDRNWKAPLREFPLIEGSSAKTT